MTSGVFKPICRPSGAAFNGARELRGLTPPAIDYRRSAAAMLNTSPLRAAGRRRAACRWWGLLLMLLCYLAGCTGSGRLEFASLDFRAVDPPAPRVSPVSVQECYWWTDQDGQVWIAMRSQRAVPFHPKLRFQFQLSLALEALPASKARNYKLGRRALRARVGFGPWESRFSSQVGIAALYRESGKRLRGSVRVQTSRVTLQWLGGWGKPVRYLMLGSFTAVPDEQRGRAIAEAAESSGWGRDAPRQPTSLPATTPTTSKAQPW